MYAIKQSKFRSRLISKLTMEIKKFKYKIKLTWKVEIKLYT